MRKSETRKSETRKSETRKIEENEAIADGDNQPNEQLARDMDQRYGERRGPYDLRATEAQRLWTHACHPGAYRNDPT
jgi:hypothetical protein